MESVKQVYIDRSKELHRSSLNLRILETVPCDNPEIHSRDEHCSTEGMLFGN